LDLKDAYFHVPILKAHRKLLHFALMGVTYEYQCLPLTRSAWRQRWSHSDVKERHFFLMYKDMLILSRSEESTRTDTMAGVEHITLLGFIINC